MKNIINNCRILSGNMLKIIAAISMLIDHIGAIIFPDIVILRIIGRIAFPIYAFMIAEGCVYTKNKLKYFLGIFVLGAACQLVYYIYDGEMYMGILITFSLSILVIYSMQYLKKILFLGKNNLHKKFMAFFVFLLAVVCVYFLNIYFKIDYGFWGCMTPVFASVFRKPLPERKAYMQALDKLPVHVGMLATGLIIISCVSGGMPYSLLAIPFLLLYSGKRGKRKMKLFFYIFYPLHLLVLEAIAVLLN